MTDGNTLDTLRQIRAAEVQTMTKYEKVAYLKSKGWRNADGNRWRNRDGLYTTFASAVTTQMLADLDGSS
jgi:hypothetical protein